jgi:hypothetical protein
MQSVSAFCDNLAGRGADLHVIDIGYCKLNLLVVIGRVRR